MEQWTTGRTSHGLGAQWNWIDQGFPPILLFYAICDLGLVNVERRLGQRSNERL